MTATPKTKQSRHKELALPYCQAGRFEDSIRDVDTSASVLASESAKIRLSAPAKAESGTNSRPDLR